MTATPEVKVVFPARADLASVCKNAPKSLSSSNFGRSTQGTPQSSSGTLLPPVRV